MSAVDTDSSGERRWPGLILGAAAIVISAALTLKPFSSLNALVLFVAAALVAVGSRSLEQQGHRIPRPPSR